MDSAIKFELLAKKGGFTMIISIYSETTIGRLGPKMIALAGMLVLGLGLAGAASAADVVVKGQQLEGSVVGVTAEGVEFQTVYGEGTIVIPWTDVEMIQSDKEFEVLYGEAEIMEGRIWGLEGDALLVGESPDRATPIPVDQIYRSITREDYEKSRLEVLRAKRRRRIFPSVHITSTARRRRKMKIA